MSSGWEVVVTEDNSALERVRVGNVFRVGRGMGEGLRNNMDGGMGVCY